MFVVSHEAGFGREVVNRAKIDGGQVVEIGSPNKLLDRPKSAQARELVGKILRD